jgi:negative regulator of flagellin synthesis FlgM
VALALRPSPRLPRISIWSMARRMRQRRSPRRPTLQSMVLLRRVSQLAAVSQEGVFDTEKVQRISEAIRDGKFTVNADAIADKLIANAQELLGAVGKR